MHLAFNPYSQKPAFKGIILIKADEMKRARREKGQDATSAEALGLDRALPFTIGYAEGMPEGFRRFPKTMGFYFRQRQQLQETEAVGILNQKNIRHTYCRQVTLEAGSKLAASA